jgi:hypothetical protein
MQSLRAVRGELFLAISDDQQHRSFGLIRPWPNDRLGGPGQPVAVHKTGDMSTAPALDTPVPYVFDAQKADALVQKRGVTRVALAVQTGKGEHTVREYLRGHTDPQAGWVGALCLILGVRPDDLYRPATENDVAVEIKVTTGVLTQVKTVSRRKRRLVRLRTP